MRIFIIAMLIASGFAFSPKPNNTSKVKSTLKSATVFRNGAELSHVANALLQQGNNELVIEGVSSYVDISSLQINCPATVTILGIEFSKSYTGEEASTPLGRTLKDSVQNIEGQLKKIEMQIAVYNDLLDVLRNNKSVKSSQSGLNVAELNRLIVYYESKSVEINNKILTTTEKQNKLLIIKNKYNTQLEEEQKKNTATGGKITLQLSASLAGNYLFNISYITKDAYWTPYYDIKADNIKSPLQFIYKAKIAQTTGIDWKKVKLTLSTSTPTQFGNAPVLKTWMLSYINPMHTLNKNLELSNTIPAMLQDKVAGLNEITAVASGTTRIRGVNANTNLNEPLYIVNGANMSVTDFNKINPESIKNIEVVKDASATAIYGTRGTQGVILVTLKDGLDDYITVTSNELDISYEIDIPYDIPTNGKQQIAPLQQTQIDAIYKYYAVPKMEKEAFLLAEVANWQTLNLLPGEANVIFEGTYIGKTFIDPANTSDTLNLTLGTDKRVVIKREKLVDFSSLKLVGNNKIQEVNYGISIKNNKKEAIHLILKDQYPISTQNDINVLLTQSTGGSINKEIGVITWQLTLQPGEVQKVKTGYSVKYPKNKMLHLN